MTTKVRIGYPYASADEKEERESVVILHPNCYSGFNTIIKEEQEYKLVHTDLGPKILIAVFNKGVCGQLIEPKDNRESIAQRGRIIGQGISMQLALVLAVFSKYNSKNTNIPLLLFSASVDYPKGASPFIDAQIETYCTEKEVLISLKSKYKATKMAKAHALILPMRDAKILTNALNKPLRKIDSLSIIIQEEKASSSPEIVGVYQDAIGNLASIIGISPYHYSKNINKNIHIPWIITLSILLLIYFTNFFLKATQETIMPEKTLYCIQKLVTNLDLMMLAKIKQNQKIDPLLWKQINSEIAQIGGAKAIELRVLKDTLKHIDIRTKIITMYVIFAIHQQRPKALSFLNNIVTKDSLLNSFVTINMQKQLFQNKLSPKGEFSIKFILKTLNAKNNEQKSACFAKLSQTDISESTILDIIPAIKNILNDKNNFFNTQEKSNNFIRFFEKHGSHLKTLVPLLLNLIKNSPRYKFAQQCIINVGPKAINDVLKFAKKNNKLKDLEYIIYYSKITNLSLIPDVLYCLRYNSQIATQKINQMKEKAIPYIVECLDHQNQRTRVLASHILAQSKYNVDISLPRIKEYLRLSLKNNFQEYDFLKNYINILKKIGPKAAHTVFDLIALTKKNPIYKKKIAIALGEMGSEVVSYFTSLAINFYPHHKEIVKIFQKKENIIAPYFIKILKNNSQKINNLSHQEAKLIINILLTYQSQIIKKALPFFPKNTNQYQLKLSKYYALLSTEENKEKGIKYLSEMILNQKTPKRIIQILNILPKLNIKVLNYCLSNNNFSVQIKAIEHCKKANISNKIIIKLKQILNSSNKQLSIASAITLFVLFPNETIHLKTIRKELNNEELDSDDKNYIRLQQYIIKETTKIKQLSNALLPTISKVIANNFNNRTNLIKIINNIQLENKNLTNALLELLKKFIHEENVTFTIKNALLKTGKKIIPILLQEILKNEDELDFYLQIFTILQELGYKKEDIFSKKLNTLAKKTNEWQIKLMINTLQK